MATDWKSKFGVGKWVTIRGAHVYVQEGAGLRSALSKLNGKKKKIMSPVRKAPKMSDGEKRIIGKNEKTIVTAKQSYRKAISSNNLDDSHKAYVALGKAENAQSINRELKGRNREPDLTRTTGAADYNNARKKDSENAWGHEGHMASVKAGIKDAQNARKAAGTNGKVRSPIYAPDKKLKLASGKNGVSRKLKASPESMQSFKNNKTAATIKRNEDTIKKYHDYDKQMGDPSSYEHFKNETKNWDQYSKLKNAAHHAQKENQRLKSQTEPGRYQMVNDYRDPQFTKGDKYGAIGGQHITRRSTPQAIETGDATQELNQIHGMRAPYGNVTYKDKLRGNWEKEIKETLYKAKSARKKAGTEGKLRSDVYKDSPQQEAAANAKKFAQKTKTTRGGTSTPTLKEALKEKAGKKTRKK